MKAICQLSPAERLQRIGELLSKGVTLMLVQQADQKRARQMDKVTTNPAPETRASSEQKRDKHDPEIETAVLNYLMCVKEASPRDIQRALKLPKSTVYRYLSRMVENQLAIRSGKTTSIRYRAARDVVQVNQDLQGQE